MHSRYDTVGQSCLCFLKFTSWTPLHTSPPLLTGKITLSPLFQMEDREEEEQQKAGSEEFNVIPPYSEKDSNIESGATGSQRGAAVRVVPVFPLMLLLTLILDWECWSYWRLHPSSFPSCAHILHSLPLSNPSQPSEQTTEDSCEKKIEKLLLNISFSLFIVTMPRCLYFVILFLLSLPPQELKILVVLPYLSCLCWSPLRWKEGNNVSRYTCMVELRSAVWANTLSRVCFTLKVQPLF